MASSANTFKNSNCTAKLGGVIESLSHRMNRYIQINVKKANMRYHKPANQNECIFSMTNKVHGTHLMLLGFLVGDLLTYKILSNETVDPYLRYFTFSMIQINLKWTIFSCV